VGRTYAGILGLIAMLTVIARGVIAGGDPQTTLAMATGCLALFAAIGAVVGRLAAWTVDDAVRARLAADVAESSSAETNVS